MVTTATTEEQVRGTSGSRVLPLHCTAWNVGTEGEGGEEKGERRRGKGRKGKGDNFERDFSASKLH